MKNLKTMTFIDGEFSMDINISVEEKTVWMTAKEIGILYGKSRPSILECLKRIKKNQSNQNSTNFVGKPDKTPGRPIGYYNLQTIVEIGIQLKSNRGIKLKEFLNDYLSKADSVFEPLDGDNDNQIIIYDNGNIKLAVNVSPKEDTVYLTKDQLAELFSTTRQNIEYHINIIYETKELEEWATCKEILQVQLEGGRNVTRTTPSYNLDLIISLGYRINNRSGIAFRQWATQVLKQYLLKGYALDSNRILITKENYIQLETDVQNIKKEIKDIKQKAFIDPPKEKLFIDGQYYDAYAFICSLLQQCHQDIVIIDPYFDLKGLDILAKTPSDINKTIVISDKASLMDSEVEAFHKQYGIIDIKHNNNFHDRFLIIDNSTCYSLGTSINHMGGKVLSIHMIEDMDIINLLIEKIGNE